MKSDQLKFVLSGLIICVILSFSVTTPAQGGGRGTVKPSPSKPPSARPSAPAKKPTPRSSSRVFRPTNPNIELVKIPPGSFMMGSTKGEDDEKPVHQVTINYSFYMGKYEVTQAQWQAVMGNNPSHFENCDSCPVENVSWDDAQSFIGKLNHMNDGYTYRLPTEAKWEYACRAGTTGEYAGALDELAWYSKNSRDRTHAVGSRRPNDWGLHDMYGNVSEWCEDWSHETYYGAPNDGSAWIRGGDQRSRVMRGHHFEVEDHQMRSAARFSGYPNARDGRATMGFVSLRLRGHNRMASGLSFSRTHDAQP